jgi:uncharacterized protein YkwD
MRYLLVVFVAVLLAAAGLGTVDSPAEAASGGYASRCGGGEIFLYAREKRLLTLHNNARKNHGLRPFCVHPALQKAAHAHSKDMIQRDYFSHDTKGKNEDACTRISGYALVLLRREHRIHCYSGRHVPLLDGHFHPPSQHILDGRFREIGIGACAGDYSDSETTMYTVDFGARPKQRPESS